MAITVRVPPAARPSTGSRRRRPRSLLLAGFVLAHAGLGQVMSTSTGLATLHAVIATVVALSLALRMTRTSDLAPAVAAAVYVGASDVLWRMTNASIPYENAKYAMSLCLFILYVRHIHSTPRPLALAYALLLTPAILLTLQSESLAQAREHISFNLAGPFAIAMAVIFFSKVRVTVEELRTIAFAVAAPIAAIGMIALVGTLSVDEFFQDSNAQASGGFGPNQVSVALSLGALVLILLALRDNVPWVRAFSAVLATAFMAQSVLTFSRGGLYNIGLAMTMVMLVHLRRPENLFKMLLGGIGVLVLLNTLFAQIDAFTGGQLRKRVNDRTPSGRDVIVADDIAIFRRHLLTGVGPGRGPQSRINPDAGSALSHTEFTRALAEHGLFGLAALIVLGLLVVIAVREKQTIWESAWAIGLMTWALADMTHAATRVALLPVAFGLAMIRLSDRSVRTDPRRRGPLIAGQ